MRAVAPTGSQQDATTASSPSPATGATVANDPVAQGSADPCTVTRTYGVSDREAATKRVRNCSATPVRIAASWAARSLPRHSSTVWHAEPTPARTVAATWSASNPAAAYRVVHASQKHTDSRVRRTASQPANSIL